jgi:LacI family transcriptional regulator
MVCRMATEERRVTVTLRDVAEQAGVSISTASRALTGTRRVHPELITRVEDAARDLGYRPNQAARSLRMARTQTFGVIFNRLESPVMLDLLDGLNAGSAERDYTLLVTSARGDASVYRHLMRRLFERRVDGLLLSSPEDVGAELETFHAAGTPVVGLLRRGPGAEDVPIVTAAVGAARTAAVQRLGELGHRRVALVGRDFVSSEVSASASAANVELVAHQTAVGETPEAFAAAVRDLATGSRPATGFIVDYPRSSMLVGVLRELGIEVPEQASVVTFTESRLTAGLIYPPMAAIDVDTHEIGRRASSLIADWVDGTPPPAVTALDVARFIERPSIGPAPMGAS